VRENLNIGEFLRKIAAVIHLNGVQSSKMEIVRGFGHNIPPDVAATGLASGLIQSQSGFKRIFNPTHD
jgi:hypothetical protein